MVSITQTRAAVSSGHRLALPMDEGRADRVIAIAGGRRERAAALIERKGEQLGVSILGFVHAGLPGSNFGVGADAEGSQDLDARVAGVHLQRNFGVMVEVSVDVVDSVVELDE